MDAPEAQSIETPHQLAIVPSGAAGSISARAGQSVIEVVTDPLALITTPRPEHAEVRGSIKQIGARSQQLAAAMDAAMHPEVAGANFWEDFAGWFGMFSLVPLLATSEVLTAVVEKASWQRARIIERPSDLGWWAGKTHFLPVAAGILDAAGVPWSVRPGKILNWLRELLMPAGARLTRARELHEELRQCEEGAKTADADIRPCDVLFTGVGAATAQIIANLWEPLRTVHGLRCAVLDLHHDRFASAIERQGLPRYDLGQFFASREVNALKAKASRWPMWYRHFAANAESMPEFSALSDGLKTAISDRVKMSLARHTPLWLLRKTGGEHALQQLTPKVVVTCHICAPPVEALVHQAGVMGISRVLVQHGVISDWYYLVGAQQLDEALVWGSHSEEVHRWLLGPDTRITQTGHSLYDRAIAAKGAVSAEIAALGEGKAALVVLATQPNEQYFYEDYASWWIAAVAEACAELDAALVLKLHPADTNHQLYQQAAQAHPDTVTISEHGQYALDELLAACDAMVTRDSTVVFEANLLGTPTVTINLTGRDDWFPYAKLGGAVGIYQREDILPQLRKVLFDEDFRRELAQKREEFLAAQVGPTDGKATERIADIVARHARGVT